jgi:hypothetical protein
VNRTIATVYRGADLAEDVPLSVDMFEDRIEAMPAPDVPWDPAGERMRG